MGEAREAIRHTLADLKTFLAQDTVPRLSEADTKAFFIEPIVAALGWVGIGVVTREYYVKNSQEFIDYVLFSSGGATSGQTPLLAIETKALQADLTEKNAAQLIQYCAVEGIEWAALTNVRELQFFNTFLKPDLTAKRVMRLDLLDFNTDEEFDILFEHLWQLSRESITTASVRTWLNQMRLDTAVRETILNPGSSPIRQLRRVLAQAEVRATPQELAQWFRTHLAPAAAHTQGGIPPRPSGQPLATVPTSGKTQGNDALTASLMSSLQSAINDRIPESKWRLLKHYTAAEVDGQTFLALKSRSRTLVVGLTLSPDTRNLRLTDNAGQFNWRRMTRIVELHSVDEINDELLSLIEAAKEYSSADQKKAYFGVTLGDLVRSGALPPGTSLVFVGHGTDLTRAEVGAVGEVLWRGGKYRSLSDRTFGPLLGPGREHFNGWIHWYAELPSGRVALADLRAAYLSDRPSTERESQGPG